MRRLNQKRLRILTIWTSYYKQKNEGELMEQVNLYSDEVEQTILGAMITNNESCLVIINEKVKSDDFYRSYNQVIFRAISRIFKEKGTVDLVMVLEELKNKNQIEKANSITYVSDLTEACITTTNITSYIELLKGYSRKRKLLDVARFINTNIGKSIEEVQQGVTGLLMEVVEEKTSNETSENQEEEYIEILEKRIKGEIVAMRTGISEIDKTIKGFNGGDLISIFAFSGVGKTTLAINIALNIIRQKKRVLIFSLEMPKEQIRDRIIANMTNIPFHKIKYGEFNSSEEEQIIKANSMLSRNKSLLVLEEDDLMNITSKIQMEVMKNNIDIVFIDYINLINIMGNNKDEYLKVTECTRLLKKLSKKIDKPIVILAQGKQEQASKMANKNMAVWDKVAVNDIAGGSAIYRDSDVVLGMYRNVELDNEVVRRALWQQNEKNIDYNSKDADRNPECMNILIKKSRASGKAIVAVKWNPKIYKIRNWS